MTREETGTAKTGAEDGGAAVETVAADDSERPNGERDWRRRLPSMTELLERREVAALVEVYGRERVVVQLRCQLDRLREREPAEPAEPGEAARAVADAVDAAGEALEAAAGRPLRRVINATGIFVHTNLGRAPLPPEVLEPLTRALEAGCDLELDLASGRRGDRNLRLERLLCLITGAEAAVAVNNNAAALLLAVAGLAAGREVVVSRGELVEIGGSFRIPELLEAAGARLVEVGTTNRTRLDDYRRAIGPDTALLLKVQPSNYRIVGFTESVSPGALAALARDSGVPLAVDEGSGLLTPHPAPQLASHPDHRALIEAGCDLVCGSGDKVLGGPQAGLLVGRRELVGRLRRHPLFRALRPGRAVVAALEAVLRRHLAGAPMPLDGMWPEPQRHRARLERLVAALSAAGVAAEIVDAEAFLGGGAAPGDAIPGLAVALDVDGRLLAELRTGDPAVVGYARDDRLVLDLRTVAASDDRALAARVADAAAALGASRPASASPRRPAG